MQKVIIIGAARSGTKFLRDTLAESRSVCSVPYDVNYVWRCGNEVYPDDAIPPEYCTDKERKYISSALRKYSHRSSDQSDCRMILEKTVSNTLRVPFVDKVFPDAKYIHLLRDGRDVIESAQRMWQAPRDISYLLKKFRYFPFGNLRYAAWYLRQVVGFRGERTKVWGPRYPGIVSDLRKLSLLGVCAMQWKMCVEYALRDLESIEPDRKKTVYYRELVSDESVIDKLCQFASVEDTDVVMDCYRKTLNADSKRKWESRWSSEELELVMEIAGPTLAKLGYI